MTSIRIISIPAALAAIALMAACSPKQAEPTAPAATTAAETPAAMPRTPSPVGARVFFITPADGATVSSPVHIEFGIQGMSVVPAGDTTPNSGHHHLLVDADLPDPGLPIPKDEHHIHFGDGSTSTDLQLSPGEHTLRLLLGDHLHIPHDPPVVSDPITIVVQ
jgi:Domain of unknown function (DUF4399)